MFIGVHVKCPLFFQILINLELSRQIFEKMFRYLISWKFASLKPSCSKWMYGETDGQTDITKQIVAFRSFLNACIKVVF